jgi:hypothetical protein
MRLMSPRFTRFQIVNGLAAFFEDLRSQAVGMSRCPGRFGRCAPVPIGFNRPLLRLSLSRIQAAGSACLAQRRNDPQEVYERGRVICKIWYFSDSVRRRRALRDMMIARSALSPSSPRLRRAALCGFGLDAPRGRDQTAAAPLSRKKSAPGLRPRAMN